MSWTSTRFDVDRWLNDDRADRCEHVMNGTRLAYAVLCEDDSFGPLVRDVVCEACYDASREEEGSVIVVCHDCKERKPMRECFEWRWYDFYAPQGDEPYIICEECETKPAHLERVRRDNDQYNAEMRYYQERGYDY